MKIIKFIASFMLVLGILVLMIWAAIKTKEQNCTAISILIHSNEKTELLTKSDILSILKHNNIHWEGKSMKEIELSNINKILAQENYIKTVDKVHFLNTKLQIEVTLYDILLEVIPNGEQKFLLDVQGVYLPYSPKVGNDVIIATGIIPHIYRKKEMINPENSALFDIYSLASKIKVDSFFSKLFHNININEEEEIILYPTVGKLPIKFGAIQDADNKLKILKYMYDEVLPYMEENAYTQLDVRFKNRIIATKNRS
ncbi:MAG: hypothetical protein LBU83_00105 [Bacteroidales bacterium]|jgi:cell division protein FtsQ|nr:hypothetical protein [Bacteroidales bacterium]